MAYKQKLNSRSKKRSRRGSHATKKRSGAGWILLILLILLVAGGAVLVTQFPEQAAQWLPDQLSAWLPTEAPAPTASTTEPTTTTTTAPRNVMVVTADSLNVRTGPGTDYDVLGTLSQGEEVVVLALEGDWYRIRYQSSEAYVHADYLMAVGETSATTVATTTTTTEETTTTTPEATTETTTSTTKKPVTTTSPQYTDRHIDEEGMLQFDAGDNYVQSTSYEGDGEIPWALLLVNDWNPMEKGYDKQVKMKKVDRNAVNSNQKVDARMYDDLMAMLDAGKKYNIGVQSSYRPYDTQERLYWNQVDRLRGTYSDPVVLQSKAGAIVKRPGYSEHNTGLAVDLYGSGDHSLTESFASTAAYKWLMDNCADYGFILRFPENKQGVTGVIYEAWHFRYVGDPDVAHAIMDNGLCLEEYLEQEKK